MSATKLKTKSSVRISSKPKRDNGKRSSNTDQNRFLEDYTIAVGVAWQIKDLLLSDDTRKAMLSYENLESAHLALKVISEASVLHCLEHDCLSTCPVSAYATLTLHMSLHNIKTDGSGDATQATISDLTLDHLLHCAYNLFRANNKKKSGKLLPESRNTSKMEPGCSTDRRECQTGTNLSNQTRISNMVKMLTAILKFIADATAMNLAPHHHDRCLNFVMENLKFINTNLREHSIAQLQFTEEEVKDIFICLKSSFTYGAKLLNIVLKTCEASLPQEGAYGLVNELFNIIVSVEELLGYGYAARFIAVVQPWVPDLILALGSHCFLKQSEEESAGACFDSSVNATFHLPPWLYILARIELCELRDTGSEEETQRVRHPKDYSAFKRLVELMTKLLRANYRILDAVGAVFLTGALNALQSRKFHIVFGLLHLVCVKLVGPEDGEWGELKLMLASLEEIYSKVELEAEELDNNEDGEMLYAAKALLEPIWSSFMHDERRQTMEEE